MSNNKESLLKLITQTIRKLSEDQSYNQTEDKRLRKFKLALEFVELGGDGVEVYPSHLIIDGNFHVTLSNKKWRVLGKGKWYPYGNPSDLLNKLRGVSHVE